MKRAIVATAAVAVGLAMTACTTSRVDPKADIDISGTVQRLGGAPVSNARLALTREGDAGDVFLVFTTLGLACLDREAGPAVCRKARLTSAGPNGRFTYRLKGSDTQSTFGYSAVLSLSTALGRKENESSGSSTTYRFHVQTEKLSLPIRLWEPTLSARTGSFGARASYSKLPAGLIPRQLAVGPTRYTLVFARGDEVVWRVTSARSGAAFDPRVLEDSNGAMRVVASASNLNVSESLGDEVAFVMRSGARPYESPLDPPISRGKECSIVDDHGDRHPIAPCSLTDGTFATEFVAHVCTGASGCVEPRHSAVFIDLGQRASTSLVVVRGCPQSCRVETSLDGRTWRLTGVAQAGEAAFPLTRSVPTRYVRVSGSPTIDGLTEVSVWSGSPRIPEGSLLVDPQRFPSPSPTASDEAAAGDASRPTKSRGFNVWVLVATALLAGVLGAGVGLLSRRKRST
jgi:hypothetical protein